MVLSRLERRRHSAAGSDLGEFAVLALLISKTPARGIAGTIGL